MNGSILIKARFIGRDRSFGYRAGRVYSLRIREVAVDGWILTAERAGLDRLLFGRGRCPYMSTKAFHENWVVLP